MADASSFRKASSLPAATGRNKGSARLETTTSNLPVSSNGTDWVVLGYDSIVYRQLTNAEVLDEVFFIAPAKCRVVAVKEAHAVAGTDASAVSIDVKKCTGTQAPSAGTTVLAAVVNAKGTANTVVSPALTATAANTLLAAGDRLGIDITGTITALAGVTVTVLIEYVA